MRFPGFGGKEFEAPPVPKEEIKALLGSKDDIVLHILRRSLNDYPVLVGNVDSQDLINRYLAKVVDILASVASNPYPTEPEVIPRFLGFSIYTVSEPRTVHEEGILEEVDSMSAGKLKVLFPKLTLKAYPDASERRRLAILGRGNQETLTILSSNVQAIFKPSYFAECFSFISRLEETDYFLLIELSEEELTSIGLVNSSSWVALASHLDRENVLFLGDERHEPQRGTTKERRKQ